MTIGNKVTSIDEYTFHGLKNLTSVIIGNSVKSIGDKAFEDCRSLESVTFGNSVTSIGEKAFYGCTSLPSVSIPNSVISIGEDAFRDCVRLTSLHIGNSVTSIGDFAFVQCPLTSLTLPSSIEDFGQEVFDSNVYSLIKEPTMLGDKIFYNGLFYKLNDSTKEAKVIGTTTSGDVVIESIIPYKNVDYIVTTIGENAFNGVFMNSIKFPNSLKTIEKGAFDGTGFINISLPEGIEKLGYNAFARCEYLKKVHLPSTLKDVSEDFIFGGCYNLESIEFDSQATVDRLGKDINNLTRGARLAKVRVSGKEADMLSEIKTPLGIKGKYYWKKNSQGSKYIVNEAGKIILPANVWDKVWFEGHIILIQKNGKYGCYSYSGTRIVAPAYDSFIGYTYTDSRLLFANATSTGGKYFVFSKAGALLTSKDFSRSQKYSMAAWMKDWVPNLVTFE